MWELRRRFWNGFSLLKFRANKPRTAPVPVDDHRRLRPIPLAQRCKSVPIANIPVADHVPADESKRARLYFCKFQAWLYRHFSPMQPGLPEIDADHQEALAAAYCHGHRNCLPAPVVPQEYLNPIDLGQLTVAGPYACYLERSKVDGYEWDLRRLDGYEHHPGLRSLGVHVQFELDEAAGRLSPVEIDCDLGVCTPGDQDWDLAQKLALCAATNHLSLVRHLNWIHLATVSQLAMATRNNLPARHPVRRLLWPHTWGTEYSNELVTQILLMKGGDFENVFSFTHAGLCDLFSDSYDQYDARIIDPLADAQRRGIAKPGFPLPYLDNRLAHSEVMHAHARRYLALYYPTDEALRADAMVMAWLRDLGQSLPNGLDDFVGDGVTVEAVARLIGGFIYVGSVEHEALGTALWNYQVWTHVQPTRIYQSGQRLPLDVYQRLMNYNFMLNVRRSPLVADFSHLALDNEGRRAFHTFRRDLEALQDRLDLEEPTKWRVTPRMLEAGVNG